jgi:hypothetical protein
MALVGTLNSQNDFAFKNRLINAGFGIWQRATSFTVAASTFTYTADRWVVYSGNSSTTVSRNTSVPTGQGFPFSAQVQRTATNTGTSAVFYQQIIESNNMLDLAGQSVTVSFWAKAGANFSSGSTGLYVNTGTTADQGTASSLGSWAGYTSAATYLFTPTTTWTKYTVTCTLSSAALELSTLFFYNPSGTAGADDSLYITGVQLEKGTTATNFDFRPYTTELQLCQRYYYKIDGTEGLCSVGSGQNTGTTESRITVLYPVKMRASPTASISGTLYILNNTGTGITITSLAVNYGGSQSAMISFGVASGLTAGSGAVMITNSASSHYFQASAEL